MFHNRQREKDWIIAARIAMFLAIAIPAVIGSCITIIVLKLFGVF